MDASRSPRVVLVDASSYRDAGASWIDIVVLGRHPKDDRLLARVGDVDGALGVVRDWLMGIPTPSTAADTGLRLVSRRRPIRAEGGPDDRDDGVMGP